MCGGTEFNIVLARKQSSSGIQQKEQFVENNFTPQIALPL